MRIESPAQCDILGAPPEPTLRILAIDPSLTACGVLVVDVPSTYILGDATTAARIGVVTSEILGCKLTAGTSREKEERIDSTARRVAEIARERKPDLVLIEGATMGARGMIFDLGAVHYAVRIALRNARFPAEIVALTTGRMLALGVGQNPTRLKVKQWIEVALQQRHGLGMDNEHLNDALVLVLAKLVEIRFPELMPKKAEKTAKKRAPKAKPVAA